MNSSFIKRTIFRVIDFVQFPIIIRLLSQSPRIFLYHGVAPTQKDFGIYNYRGKFISPVAFRKQLLWLKKNYTILPLPYYIELLLDKKRFPPNVCSITFDDGYLNNYEFAFPLLKEFAIPATFFVTTDFVDQKTPLWVDILEYAIGKAKAPELRIIYNGQPTSFNLSTYRDRCATDSILRNHLKKIPRSHALKLLEDIVQATGTDLRKKFHNSPYQAFGWDNAREMASSGMTIMPHTLSHPILSQTPPQEVLTEISDSRNRVQKEMEKRSDLFAYPNGQSEDFSMATVELLKKLEFKAALTTISDVCNEETKVFEIPRITLDNTNNFSLFRIKATSTDRILKNFYKKRW